MKLLADPPIMANTCYGTRCGRSDVRQGFPISPLIFNIFIDTFNQSSLATLADNCSVSIGYIVNKTCAKLSTVQGQPHLGQRYVVIGDTTAPVYLHGSHPPHLLMSDLHYIKPHGGGPQLLSAIGRN
eukprot:352480-Chlamydomonas_euryale.AAC.7